MKKKRRRNEGKPLRPKGRFQRNCKIAVIVVVVLAGAVTSIKISNGLTRIEQPAADNPAGVATKIEAESEAETAFNAIYEQYSNDDIYNSNLILVNNDTEYKAQGKEELVSIYDLKNQLHAAEGSDPAFGVTDSALQLRKNAAESLVSMLDNFYKETGNDNIVVCSAYRTKEGQQELYDEDLENTGLDYSTRVAIPGFSEHESGFAIDLTLYDGEYDGTGEYAWINENCAKYGFILRYPESKTDITQIEYESWHYRYVGVSHASYIMDNDICLEEYISLLRENYAVSDESSNILTFKAANEKYYSVFFVAADTASESTYVPVPSDKEYEVMGNNVDGFIVTFESDESYMSETEAAQDTKSTGNTENTSTSESEDIASEEESSELVDVSSENNE